MTDRPGRYDGERIRYDWTELEVIAELRRLASLGCTWRELGWAFGMTGSGLRSALERDSPVALEAVTRAWLELRTHALGTIRTIADDPGAKNRLGAAKYLRERTAEMEDLAERVQSPAEAPPRAGTADEVRARLSIVREAQRAG